MPTWLIDTFTVVNTGLLLFCVVLLLIILNHIEARLRREDKENTKEEKRKKSWDQIIADRKAEREGGEEETIVLRNWYKNPFGTINEV